VGDRGFYVFEGVEVAEGLRAGPVVDADLGDLERGGDKGLGPGFSTTKSRGTVGLSCGGLREPSYRIPVGVRRRYLDAGENRVKMRAISFHTWTNTLLSRTPTLPELAASRTCGQSRESNQDVVVFEGELTGVEPSR
jgi:hypothetical protein